MKEISVFDVIGPNMIGPSSSHTAGALRIARVAYKLASKGVKKAEFTLYGSFAKTYKGHGTDRALLGGLMGFDTEDERIKDAYQYADQMGLKYTFITNETETDVHPNTVDIRFEDGENVVTTLTGASIGGGNIRIEKINGVEVSFNGEYSTLIIHHIDTVGVIHYMTKCLSDSKVNIAYMKLYRENKGEDAYAIIEADEMINQNVIKQILKHDKIISAKIIEL